MLESNADLQIILTNLQQRMSSLTMSNQGSSSLAWINGERGLGRGMLQGRLLNIHNIPVAKDATSNQWDTNISQLNKIVRYIQNEPINLRHGDEIIPIT